MRQAFKHSWDAGPGKWLPHEHETLAKLSADPKNWKPHFAWIPVWTGHKLLWLTPCYRLIYTQVSFKLRDKHRNQRVNTISLVSRTTKYNFYATRDDLILKRLRYAGD